MAQPEVAELISMENRQGLDGGAQVAQRKRREPVQSSWGAVNEEWVPGSHSGNAGGSRTFREEIGQTQIPLEISGPDSETDPGLPKSWKWCYVTHFEKVQLLVRHWQLLPPPAPAGGPLITPPLAAESLWQMVQGVSPKRDKTVGVPTSYLYSYVYCWKKFMWYSYSQMFNIQIHELLKKVST